MRLTKQFIGIITSAAILASMSPIGVIAYSGIAETVPEDIPPELFYENDRSMLDIDEPELIIEDVSGEPELISIAEGNSSDIAAEGTYGENITYTLSSDGVLTFTGTGAMMEFTTADYKQNPFYSTNDLAKQVTKVVVGDGITSVGAYNFLSCPNIQSIELSDTVTAIGTCAFRNNASLTTVSIGAGVTSIDTYVFDRCAALATINYAGSPSEWAKVKVAKKNDPLYAAKINYAADVVIVQEGTYGANVKYTLDSNGVLTFTGTGAMTEFTTADYKQNPFYSSNDLTKQITKVVVGEGITSVGAYNFLSCPNTQSIELSDTVTALGTCAFRNNASLTTVSIGTGMTSIDTYVFDRCAALATVNYAGSPSEWAKITVAQKNDPLYAAELICAKEDIKLPCGDNLEWNFDGESASLVITGDGEMYNWTADDTANIPWIEIAGNIKNVVIGDGVTSIGSNAFSMLNIGIESFTIGSGVKAIGEQALPVWYCLGDITYNGTRDAWTAVTVAAGNDMEYRTVHCTDDPAEPEASEDPDIDPNKCGKELLWTLEGGTLTITGTGAMYNRSESSRTMPWSDSVEQITDLVIADGVTSIGSYAFYDCVNLVNVTIPASVEKIGAHAFGNNSAVNKLSCHDRDWFESVEIGADNLWLTFANEIDFEVPASAEIQTISIYTAEDIEKIRQGIRRRPDYCNNKRFVLENDIDLEGAIVDPIGIYIAAGSDQYNYVFDAEFDGNGHTISNAIIRGDANEYSIGFFGAVTDNGSIKNLTLDNVVVGAGMVMAGWSGILVGTLVDDGVSDAIPTVENCHVKNSSLSETASANCFTGAIAGKVTGGIITGCTTENVTVKTTSGHYAYVGGIIGHVYIGTVSGCTSGTVVENNTLAYAGGIAGCTGSTEVTDENDVIISDCTATAEAGVNYNSGIAGGTVALGGIVGFASSGKIMDCTSYAPVNATCASPVYAGGIAGFSQHSVSGCVSSSAIKLNTQSYGCAGGIEGWCQGLISDCETVNADLNVTAVSAARIGGTAANVNSFTALITDCETHDSRLLALSTKSQAHIGGITAACYGKITGCNVYNTIMDGRTSSGTNGNAMLGGISGILGASGQRADNAIPAGSDPRIENCSYNGTGSDLIMASVTSGYLGGIAGVAYAPASISDCHALFGDNVTTSTGNHNVTFGGVLGRSYTTEVEHCITEGLVTINDTASAGGILGSVSAYVPYIENIDGTIEAVLTGTSINECLSELELNATGTEIKVGGIVGYLNGQLNDMNLLSPVVSRSAALGDIRFRSSEERYSFVGGAVGYIVDAKVQSCFAAGDIYEIGAAAYDDIEVQADRTGVDIGGFVGSLKEYDTASTYPFTEATNCFATGSISLSSGNEFGLLVKGGFAGSLRDNNITSAGNGEYPAAPVVKNCYYYSDEADNKIGTKLSADQLLNKDSYNTFDFATLWYMSDDGAHLRIDRAGVCSAVYQYDNNIISGIQLVTLSRPSEINTVYIELTTVIGGKEYESRTIELPITNVEKNAQFSDIECNIVFEPYEQITSVYTNLPMTTAEIKRTDTADDTEYSFTVTPEAACESCYAYAAVYDIDGKLLAVKRVPLEMTGDTVVSVNKSADAALAKVFVWTDTIQPLIESAKEFPLAN